MILTKEQIDFVNAEGKRIQQTLDLQPKLGAGTLRIQQEALWMITKLHNIAIEKQRKDKKNATTTN